MTNWWSILGALFRCYPSAAHKKKYLANSNKTLLLNFYLLISHCSDPFESFVLEGGLLHTVPLPGPR